MFSFGDGEEGQLGHDSTNSEPRPRLVQPVLWGKHVAQVVCGGSHTLAVTGMSGPEKNFLRFPADNNELYSWGNPSSAKLGHIVQESTFKPREVGTLASVPVLQVAAGKRHSLALTSADVVLSCCRPGASNC